MDLARGRAGRRLGETDPKTEGDAGPAIVNDLATAAKGGADVAIVTTTSFFDKMAPTLRACMANKLHVVSSCEEMAWPRYRHPKLADGDPH